MALVTLKLQSNYGHFIYYVLWIIPRKTTLWTRRSQLCSNPSHDRRNNAYASEKLLKEEMAEVPLGATRGNSLLFTASLPIGVTSATEILMRFMGLWTTLPIIYLIQIKIGISPLTGQLQPYRFCLNLRP